MQRGETGPRCLALGLDGARPSDEATVSELDLNLAD